MGVGDGVGDGAGVGVTPPAALLKKAFFTLSSYLITFGSGMFFLFLATFIYNFAFAFAFFGPVFC